MFDSEVDVLSGLPTFQFKLYFVLRWYMDRATGLVGVKRGISLKSLAEEMYVEPVRGRHAADAGEPSRKAIRSALDGLVKARLLEPCGNGEVLVFLMPLARRALSRAKDEGHMRGTDQGRDDGKGKSRAGRGFRDDDGRDEGEPKTDDEGHTSRVKKNLLSVETSSSSDCGVVDKKLSTVAPVMVMNDLSIAEWIRAMERGRGKVARVHVSDVRAAGWVAEGVSSEDIADAYATAVQARRVDQNPAPVNVQYVDSILRSTLSRRQSAVREGGRNAPAGISAFSQSEAAAIRMGVDGPAVGESAGAFISRIAAEGEARRLGLPGQQQGESVVEFMSRLSAARSSRRKAM